jgi:glycine dehydrogenase
VKNSSVALVSEGIYPADLEVLQTLAIETSLTVQTYKIDTKTGRIDLKDLELKLKSTQGICAVAFPQINSLGIILNNIFGSFQIASFASAYVGNTIQ